MERTREMIEPSEALKLVVATLNSPSIRHERVEMRDIYISTAGVFANRGAVSISITARGVVTEGLADILAVVHAWKPALFDVARVRGERAYERKGPRKVPEINPAEIDRMVQASARGHG